MKQLAEIVVELTQTTSQISFKPLPEDDPKVRQPDITRARAMLQWEPKVDVREGISRTIEYFHGSTGARTQRGGAEMTRPTAVVGAAIVVAVLTVASACRPGFQPRGFASSGALFTASLREYNLKRYDNAVTGFERLTLDLSARDSLLPLSHWYLAHAHELKNEHLLAASSYTRLAESFPDDSLAPAALLLAGRSYSELWRRPDLDPTYGDLAQIQFRQLASLYPDSPLRKQADSSSADIDERKASKDYGIGMHYVRRKGYESSLIYFKDVVKDYPATKMAREALIEMVVVYRRPSSLVPAGSCRDLSYVADGVLQLTRGPRQSALVPALLPGRKRRRRSQRKNRHRPRSPRPDQDRAPVIRVVFIRCASESLAGPSIRPTSAICWLPVTRMRRCRWTGSCSSQRPASR